MSNNIDSSQESSPMTMEQQKDLDNKVNKLKKSVQVKLSYY